MWIGVREKLNVWGHVSKLLRHEISGCLFALALPVVLDPLLDLQVLVVPYLRQLRGIFGRRCVQVHTVGAVVAGCHFGSDSPVTLCHRCPNPRIYVNICEP